MTKASLDFTKNISSCYRSFYHFNSSDFSSKNLEIIFGDSYSEGSGDEFLSGKKNYGLYKKLINKNFNKSYLLFGRSGFGTISNFKEFQLCNKLIKNFTSISYDTHDIEVVTFMFYEGNDLIDNLRENEFGSQKSLIKERIRFFLPLLDFLYRKIRNYDYSSLFINQNTVNIKEYTYDDFATTSNGIKFPVYPQHPHLELTNSELKFGLELFEQYLKKISLNFPNSRLQLIYIPATTSVYDFDKSFYVRSYKNPPKILVSNQANVDRHLFLVDEIQKISNNYNWRFCDSSKYLRHYTSNKIPVNGPRDWAHFNFEGYTALSKAYINCFIK